jgi:hypothetical protein
MTTLRALGRAQHEIVRNLKMASLAKVDPPPPIKNSAAPLNDAGEFKE